MKTRKRYGIYDLNHHAFFKFGFGDEDDDTSEEPKEEYEFFRTKKECREAIKFCNLVFFYGNHKFVVKPHW